LIKYIGSKRRLVAALGDIAATLSPATALDLFSGTTRVAQALKRQGAHVTAVDSEAYAWTLARCYVATDLDEVDPDELGEVLDHLDHLPGRAGYVTETFCRNARFFQPHNGERIDAIRTELTHFEADPLYPVLLTALLEAADRVDSTTGLQMAYLKQWAPRSFGRLRLRSPRLLPGPGRALHGDATGLVWAGFAPGRPSASGVDLAYLDPPYNQHRYASNYHIWETLVRGDEPEHYGTACKRIDLRDKDRRSPFNSRRTFPAAMAALLSGLSAQFVIVSYNDESWVSMDQMSSWLRDAGHRCVAVMGFPSKRYVGAQIGIHNPAGERVGTEGRRSNTEWLFLAGTPDDVAAAVGAGARHGGEPMRVPVGAGSRAP
jgi:adenine-specific DNA-methyltransferase